MWNLLFLILVFLMFIVGVIIYYNSKGSTIDKLRKGICPKCGETKKTFTTEEGKKIVSPAISTNILNKGG